MIVTCPVCKKERDVPHPDLWVYKRGSRYLCSWTCLRAFDAKHGEPRQLRKGDALNVRRKGLTLEEKKRAVQECLEGKNPLDYLTSIGVKTPAQTWHDIKKKLKQREDMFLRWLFGMLAKMAKTGGKAMIFCPSVVDL